MARLRLIGIALLLATAVIGCRARPKPFPVTTAPVTRPIEILKKPAIDLSRSSAGFPLDTTDKPDSVDKLGEALKAGYARRLTQGSPTTVEIAGTDLANLDRINIDLTGSYVRSDYQPANITEPESINPELHVNQLHYIANPMHYTTYTGSMELDASNVDLGYIAGPDKKLYLVLADCAQGSARLKIDLHDLEKGLVAGSRVRSALGIGLDSMEISLRTPSEKTIEAEFVVHARILMIPATFRLTGRADVNDEFLIYFTQLNVAGDDPTGTMIAAVVQAKLDKINNKAAPLLRLPGNRIHITDFAVKVEDGLQIDVKFKGSKK